MNERASSHSAGHHAPAFAPAIGLREVLEASPDLVFCCDAWGRFAWVSATFESLAGWRATELVGQPFTQLLPQPDRAGAVRAFYRQRRRVRPLVERDIEMNRADGTSLALAARVRLYQRPDGEAYYVGIARERVATAAAPANVFDMAMADETMAAAAAAVTEAAAATSAAVERAKALEAQLDEARSQSQMKGEFLATLSHEVRTPMHVVIQTAHQLLQGPLSPEQRHQVGVVLDSTQSLMGLVSDAIDYSRLETGSLGVDQIDFDLRVAMEQVAGGLGPAAEARGLSFDARVEALVPSRLKGDPGRLRQVLLNLGQNAIKCTENGKVLLRAEREREDDTHVTILFRVESTGSAVAPEAAPIRPGDGAGSDSDARGTGGSALALAISRRLVERMGGQVGVGQQFARGNSFGFRLTLEKQTQAVVAPAPTNVQLRGLRVLVADGAESERRTTSEVLAAWGVSADTAENGLEALQLMRHAAAESRPYAVALLDLQLEGLDGEALCSAVRADSALDPTLLMLTTRVGRPGDAVRMKAMGYSAYLVQPIDCSQLFDALSEVVSGQGTQVPQADRPLVTRHSLAEAKRGRLRILLVEDDVVNQLVTQSALHRVGYNVEIAPHGRSAIEMTENQHWDLILMDTQMPGLDGYRATEAIRARERGSRRTPILGLTGDSSFSTDREKCMAAGMDDVFRKPIDLAELTTAVERWTVRGDSRPAEAAPEPAHAPRFTVVSSHFDPPAESSAHPAAALVHGDLQLPDGPAIDLEQLNTASMGLPALRTSLLHTYLDDVYPRLERLTAAIASGDAHRVEFEAHGLRGMCATIGASACTMLFGEMESAARDERVHEATHYLDAARTAVQRTEEFIHRLERIVTDKAA
jgi:PAS domain S-box-containing protein